MMTPMASLQPKMWQRSTRCPLTTKSQEAQTSNVQSMRHWTQGSRHPPRASWLLWPRRIIIGCAGGTDALSGTASYLSRHPVVSCPPDGMNQTCLTNPPGSSNAFIVKPSNVAKFAAQFFAHSCPEVSTLLDASIQEKIRKLEEADDRLVKKARTM